MTVGLPATVCPEQPTIPTITATKAVMSPTRRLCPARTAVPNAPMPAACPPGCPNHTGRVRHPSAEPTF
jgi:hypothetical protein